MPSSATAAGNADSVANAAPDAAAVTGWPSGRAKKKSVTDSLDRHHACQSFFSSGFV